MAKRTSADRFHVGQTVAFVLGPGSKWERANGELAIVMGGKRYDDWRCGGLDGSQRRMDGGSWRYPCRWRSGINWFCEHQLRAIYDAEPLSTWDKFAKATGLQLARDRFVARAVKAKKTAKAEP